MLLLDLTNSTGKFKKPTRKLIIEGVLRVISGSNSILSWSLKPNTYILGSGKLLFGIEYINELITNNISNVFFTRSFNFFNLPIGMNQFYLIVVA